MRELDDSNDVKAKQDASGPRARSGLARTIALVRPALGWPTYSPVLAGRTRHATPARSRGATHGAVEVVARALAVELAGAEVDVRGAVAVHPRLGLKAVGAGVAGVESDGLKDGEHCVTQRSGK